MTVSEAVNKLYAMVFPKKDEAKGNDGTNADNNDAAKGDDKSANMADQTPPAGGDVEARVASLEDAVNKILQMMEALNGNANATAMKEEVEKLNGELSKFSAELEKLKADPDGEVAGKTKKVEFNSEQDPRVAELLAKRKQNIRKN